MKRLYFTLILFLLSNVYIFSATTLSFRYSNPKIVYSYNDTYFGNCINLEWDIEIMASVADTRYWSIQIIQNYNAGALNDFYFVPGSFVSSRYTKTSNTNSGYLNLFITSTDPVGDTNPNKFSLIPTTYTKVGTFKCRITNQSALAGISFRALGMDGQEQEKLIVSPWTQYYTNPNIYEGTDLTNLYLGRVYSAAGWSQYGGSTLDVLYTDWATSVNTSIWEGTATIPTTGTSLASAVRIHSPATLTIPNTGQLTVSGATEINTANGLVIQSDATGTGSLITGSASGSASVQRWMTTGAWHIVSSPLSQSVSDFLGANANVATATNGTDRGMMDYIPATNEWSSFFTNSSGGSLGAGKGFSMRVGASDAAVTFTGSLQAGGVSASTAAGYWNCIGNPYTSAIGIATGSASVSKFLDINASNFEPSYGAIYVWNKPDASNGLTGNYTAISNTSPDFTDVQQGQAFMVNAKAAVFSFSFTSAMQTHLPALALKSAETAWPSIKLEATVGAQISSTIIAFNNGMTKGLDPTYDAGLLKGASDLIVYTKLVEDNGIPFAIQALPANDYSSMIIPVGLDFKTGGDVVFSAALTNLPLDCKVILEDKLTKTFTDLSKNVYTATIAANSSISDRFQIHTSYQTTGIAANGFDDQLSAYTVRNTEIRVKGSVSKQAVATLYDIQGRVVLVKNLEEGNLNIIGTPNLRTGIYMLYVKDNNKFKAFKLPVTE